MRVTRPLLFAVAIPLFVMAAATRPSGAAQNTVPVTTPNTTTFYEHVAPILTKHCVTCHQPVGANLGSLVAPMSLITYDEVRPWARAIARKVQTREMPPWFADYPKGVFLSERGLAEGDIQTILAWVAAGAPAGDKSKAVAPPVSARASTDGYSLGKPDLVVRAEPFVVADDMEDIHVNFYVKIPETLLPRNVFVRALELRAGTHLKGAHAVHHMCSGLREPASIASEGGEGAFGMLLGCVAGGTEPTVLPDGFGLELKKDSTIVFNMHYYKEKGSGSGFTNQPEVGFYFATGPTNYHVVTRSIGTTSFEIPPHKADYHIGAGATLEKDALVLAYWPHAHLRAASARYTATYPDGRQEVLLNVPRYDQSWQVTYTYRQPKLLPKGTRIDVEMVYDNSEHRGNKRQFDPTETVRNGPRTQDEMMGGVFTYADVEPGDPILAVSRPQ